MCRSIKVLYNSNHLAPSEEVKNASRQYVRKISGISKPSRANEVEFERAVEEISKSSNKLLESITTN